MAEPLRDELDVLRDVARKLTSARVPYMLTGSFAMMFYVAPRFTRDIDLVIQLSVEEIESFVRTFASEYYISSEAMQSSVAHRSMFNAIHNDTIIKVDFIIQKDTAYRRAEFERRRQVPFEGEDLWIVSKEDLIISKLDWARDSASEYQLRDVKALVESGCDVEYIEQWTGQLNLRSLWQGVRP
jgi:hypothetical protein